VPWLRFEPVPLEHKHHHLRGGFSRSENSRYFLRLVPRYSPQHPETRFLPSSEMSSFTRMQYNSKYEISLYFSFQVFELVRAQDKYRIRCTQIAELEWCKPWCSADNLHFVILNTHSRMQKFNKTFKSVTMATLFIIVNPCIKVKIVATGGQSASLSWCKASPPGFQDQIFVTRHSCRFVDVWGPLWREDEPVLYNCC
jgi:hypothetical protein